MFKKVTVAALLIGVLACFAQSSKTSVTGLLTQDEFRRAGLSKLTPQEIQSLDAALFRVLTALGAFGRPSGLGAGAGTVSEGSDFFDSRGAAIAYFDDDEVVYLWSGEPVAYRDEDSLFGFNGSHLGWLHEGAIYDHDGDLVAAVAGRLRGAVRTPPVKDLKELKPLRGLKELKPLKPLFGSSWSRIPARSFFLAGIK